MFRSALPKGNQSVLISNKKIFKIFQILARGSRIVGQLWRKHFTSEYGCGLLDRVFFNFLYLKNNFNSLRNLYITATVSDLKLNEKSALATAAGRRKKRFSEPLPQPSSDGNGVIYVTTSDGRYRRTVFF